MENENTAALRVETDALQKQYRETNDMVTLVIGQLHDLNKEKQTVTDEIVKLKELFVTTSNEIAAQKLEWIQQKAQEESELEGKKNAVQEILDKEQHLNDLKIILEKEKLHNQEILNESSRLNDETAKEKVSNQVILDEARVIKKDADAQKADNQRKVDAFKENIMNFHDKLAADIASM